MGFRMAKLVLLSAWAAGVLFGQHAFLSTSASSKSKINVKSITQQGGSCPNNQGGLLNSISVPISEPLTLYVYIDTPSDIDEPFDVSSDNPNIANAGDATQAFLGTVVVPAGAQYSNAFTVIGNSIGQANIIIASDTGDYGTSSTPIGPWDVNPGNDTFAFVDANPPHNSCLANGSADFSVDPNVLSQCGAPVYGLASDGVTQLLLRTAAGISGTMCYQITSTSALDQGSIQDAVLPTGPGPNDYQYGFTYYTGPTYYGDNSNSRTVDVLFTFTPSQGNGNTTTIPGTLTIVRPPVMLLHGIWADASTWNDSYVRNDDFHTTYPGDYSQPSNGMALSNSASFSVNEPYVDIAVQTALDNFRQKQYAATQADVVAHSMGGLLTRLYVGSDSFQQPTNYNMGDIHRLVTLDTPHLGSSFANLMVSLYNSNAKNALGQIAKLPGAYRDITQGAVCDLAENSPALTGLSGGTSLQSQVITATGGPAGTPNSPASYWKGATAFGVGSFEDVLTQQYCTHFTSGARGNPVCTAYAYYLDQNIVNAFRFIQGNDAIVALSSQQGGLGGTNYPAYIHFHIPAIPFVQRGITDGSDVTTQVFSLLDGPDSGFSASLPGVLSDGTGAPRTVNGLGAATDSKVYKAQCNPGPLKPSVVESDGAKKMVTTVQPNVANPSINVVSPTAGTVFHDGDTINIVIALTAPLTNQNTVGVTLSGLTHLTATWTSGLSFSASYIVPAGVSGSVTITPDLTDTLGNYSTGGPITVGVTPAGTLQSLSLQNALFVLHPGAPNQQLVVSGSNSGTVYNLTSVLTGTFYRTSNSSVAVVTGDGVIQIIGPGSAVITVQNGGVVAYANVLVQNPASPLPPQVVTPQFAVQLGGYRLNRTTGFFTQTVTLTNSSKLPVLGPLNFVLSGLTTGVTLEHATGVTHNFESGSPYVSVPLSSDGVTFAPNSTITLTLQFLNPKRVSISYSPAIVGVATRP